MIKDGNGGTDPFVETPRVSWIAGVGLTVSEVPVGGDDVPFDEMGMFVVRVDSGVADRDEATRGTLSHWQAVKPNPNKESFRKSRRFSTIER